MARRISRWPRRSGASRMLRRRGKETPAEPANFSGVDSGVGAGEPGDVSGLPSGPGSAERWLPLTLEIWTRVSLAGVWVGAVSVGCPQPASKNENVTRFHAIAVMLVDKFRTGLFPS